jgi:hypothetical protein
MRDKRVAACLVGAAFAALALGGSLPALAAGCDEYNPASPARSTRVTLTATDAVDDSSTALRSFVETGSLGKVDISLVRSSRGGPVQQILAVPHISRRSANYGEELKGVEISAALSRPLSGARIVVEVRQVCAQHFRNSFLHE